MIGAGIGVEKVHTTAPVVTGARVVGRHPMSRDNSPTFKHTSAPVRRLGLSLSLSQSHTAFEFLGSASHSGSRGEASPQADAFLVLDDSPTPQGGDSHPRGLNSTSLGAAPEAAELANGGDCKPPQKPTPPPPEGNCITAHM